MNPSVLFTNTLFLDDHLSSRLDELPFSSTGTRRICLHENEDSNLHLMLVQLREGVLFPVHRHLDGDEFIFAVNGSLEVTIWENSIHKTPLVVTLNQKQSTTAIRIPMNTWHTTRSLDGDSKYFEVKPGPFSRKNLEIYSGNYISKI